MTVKGWLLRCTELTCETAMDEAESADPWQIVEASALVGADEISRGFDAVFELLDVSGNSFEVLSGFFAFLQRGSSIVTLEDKPLGSCSLQATVCYGKVA